MVHPVSVGQTTRFRSRMYRRNRMYQISQLTRPHTARTRAGPLGALGAIGPLGPPGPLGPLHQPVTVGEGPFPDVERHAQTVELLLDLVPHLFAYV